MKKYLLVIIFIGSNFQLNVSKANPPEQPTIGEYVDALITALGSDAQRFRQMILALANYCAVGDNFNTGMDGHCDDLFRAALNGNTQIIRRVMRTLRPREVVQQNRMASDIVNTQQANLGARMTQLRSFSSGSLAGLSLSQGNKNIPIEMLTYLRRDSSDTNELLSSPWGFFVNGRVSLGDYNYTDANDEGFDFETEGVTIGVDYRFNDQFVAGLALGYANFDSEIGTDINMNTESISYSLYASLNATEKTYIDLRYSHGNNDYEQGRKFQFLLDVEDIDHIALGETEGDQSSFILSAGHQFNKNGWQITPSVSIEYYETDVDPFVETNAGGWNVGYSAQNFKTMRYTTNLQFSKSISTQQGVFIPYFGLRYNYEEQKGDEFIFMRISGMPAGEFFNADTQFNDNTYFDASLGFSYVTSNGKQAFFQYSETLGFNGLDRSSFNLGLRFEF